MTLSNTLCSISTTAMLLYPNPWLHDCHSSTFNTFYWQLHVHKIYLQVENNILLFVLMRYPLEREKTLIHWSFNKSTSLTTRQSHIPYRIASSICICIKSGSLKHVSWAAVIAVSTNPWPSREKKVEQNRRWHHKASCPGNRIIRSSIQCIWESWLSFPIACITRAMWWIPEWSLTLRSIHVRVRKYSLCWFLDVVINWSSSHPR